MAARKFTNIVTFAVTDAEAIALDQAAAKLRVTRSWLIRESLYQTLNAKAAS